MAISMVRQPQKKSLQRIAYWIQHDEMPGEEPWTVSDMAQEWNMTVSVLEIQNRAAAIVIRRKLPASLSLLYRRSLWQDHVRCWHL